MYVEKNFKVISCAAVAAMALVGSFSAVAAESTLEIVKNRGYLRCQVGTPSPGFYNFDANGEWQGSDVSICQAVAAAIFGDKTKLEIQSVSSSKRFVSLAAGDSDLLSRTATWTLGRDSQLGIDFVGVNFYDGQGFMVRKDSGITNALELQGATVCVRVGSTTELNLTDFSRANNLNIVPLTFEDKAVRNDTYAKGGCDALTNDKSGLASNRTGFSNPEDHVILPDTISKEPLSPAVRQGDDRWFNIVRWTLNALIQAEESGVTQANIDDLRANSIDPTIRRLLGVEGDLHNGLGLESDWAYNAIKAGGNYGEIYERYIGDQGLQIPRAGTANALWTNGGLIYSPPFREVKKRAVAASALCLEADAVSRKLIKSLERGNGRSVSGCRACTDKTERKF